MEIAQTVFAPAPDGQPPAPQAGTALAGLFARFLSALLGPNAGGGAGSPVVPAEAAHEGTGSPAEAGPTAVTLAAVPPDGEARRAPDTSGTAGDEAAAPEETATMAAAFCEGFAPDGSNPRPINQSDEQPPTAGLPLYDAGTGQLPLQAGAVAGADVAVGREILHGADGRVKQPAAGVAPAAQPGRSLLASAGTEDAVLAVQAKANAPLLTPAGETRPDASGPQEAPVPTLAGAPAEATQTGKACLQPPAQGTNLLPQARPVPTGLPAAGGAQSLPPAPGQDFAPGNRTAPTDGMPEAGPKALPAQNTQPLSLADAGPLLLQAGLRTGTGTAAGRQVPGGLQGAVGQAAAGVPGLRAGPENAVGDRLWDTPTGLREKAVAGPLNGPAPVTAATPPAGPQPVTAQLAVAVVRHIEQLRQQPGRPLRIEIALEPPELGRVTVRLSLMRGELTAQFYTGDVFARDALAASLPQLREALAQHNIWLGQAHVFLGQDGRAGHAPYTWAGRGFSLGPSGGAEAPVPEANARPDYDARLLNYLV